MAITDLAGLKTWAGAGGAETIAAGTYTLDADLVIAKSASLTATGAVIIDGDSQFAVICECPSAATADVLITLTGTKAYPITVTNGLNALGAQFVIDNNSTSHYALTVNATYLYCNSAEADNNGLNIAGSPTGEVTVTVTNGTANSNPMDGYSIKSPNAGNYSCTLRLINCVATGNGSANAASGDGFTCHSRNHHIYIDGGAYYSNTKSGGALVGENSAGLGGTAFIRRAAIYDNGGTVTTNGDLYCSDDFQSLTIDQCIFSGYDIANATGGPVRIGAVANTLITNTVFCNPVSIDGAFSVILASEALLGPLVVKNCDFVGFVFGTRAIYAIEGYYAAQGLTVSDCRFIGGRQGVRTPNGAVNYVVADNYFIGHTANAVYDANSTTKYGSMTGCGRNWFVGITTPTQSTTTQASDYPQTPVFSRGGSGIGWW